jgi:hypothetical protein
MIAFPQIPRLRIAEGASVTHSLWGRPGAGGRDDGDGDFRFPGWRRRAMTVSVFGH